MRPGCQSGHYQRKVDQASGINLKSETAQFYKVAVPQHSRYDASRTSHNMLVRVPHEALAKEFAENPDARTGPADFEWTESYRNHPVVVKNPTAAVIPYALYLDGISYTNKDSLLGIFANRSGPTNDTFVASSAARACADADAEVGARCFQSSHF
jgi:hypothetical protein